MTKTKKTIIKIAIATGGTGGHIFPAQSLADSLIEHNITPILICDDRTTKFLQGSFTTIEKFYITSDNMSGSFNQKILGLYKLIFSIFKVRSYLKKIKPAAIVSFGGYPTFPTLVAAASLKIPTIAYEQNSVLGRVNRFLLPIINHLCITFPHTIGLKEKHKSKTFLIGSIVRKEAVTSKKPKKYKDKIYILIIGGSQGAQILSEIIPSALLLLDQNLQKKLIIYQQARENLVEETYKTYKNFKGKVTIKPFFDNIGNLLSKADFLICRSGASTIAEVIHTHKPAILIPFPYATDNHQYYNASFLVNNDAGIMITQQELTSHLMAAKLKELITSPNTVTSIQQNLKKLSKNNSLEKLITVIKNSIKRH